MSNTVEAEYAPVVENPEAHVYDAVCPKVPPVVPVVA
jgi:hypothetical protein